MSSVTHALTMRLAILLTTLLLSACGHIDPGPYPGWPGPAPPIAGSASGGLDPAWMVCQGGNPRLDYNCTLN